MSFVDVRDHHPDYKRAHCPECGVERLFKRSSWDDTDVAICQTCNARERHDVEIACPACEHRMTYEDDSDRWQCQTCEETRWRPKSDLIDRMTEVGEHRPGFFLGETCPRCKDDRGAHTDPDGTVLCRECDGIYIWQYSDEWWAYAEWLIHRGPTGRTEAPAWIRVNFEEADS